MTGTLGATVLKYFETLKTGRGRSVVWVRKGVGGSLGLGSAIGLASARDCSCTSH